MNLGAYVRVYVVVYNMCGHGCVCMCVGVVFGI